MSLDLFQWLHFKTQTSFMCPRQAPSAAKTAAGQSWWKNAVCQVLVGCICVVAAFSTIGHTSNDVVLSLQTFGVESLKACCWIFLSEHISKPRQSSCVPDKLHWQPKGQWVRHAEKRPSVMFLKCICAVVAVFPTIGHPRGQPSHDVTPSLQKFGVESLKACCWIFLSECISKLMRKQLGFGLSVFVPVLMQFHSNTVVRSSSILKLPN